MINQIYPCLWFDGQAKEAAEFYCGIFKNSKITADTPMVVNFELNGKKFMGLNGGPMFKINPSVSFFVNCKTEADTNEIYDKLSAGGSVLMPIGKYDWSERYGWITDKYGATWQIMLGDTEKITSSLLFTNKQCGRAEEAMKFYATIFKNSSINRVEYYPEGNADAGKVMYAEFNLNKHNLIAMDGPGNHAFNFNEAVSFVVNCETQEEIDYYWNKLTEGGNESQCGWLKDKFGLSWQIVPAILGKLMTDSEKAQKIMQVVMQTTKFDIEKLINA